MDIELARAQFRAIIESAGRVPIERVIGLAQGGLMALEEIQAAGPIEFLWPTSIRPAHITQFFGENPADYARFGLIGHEGIDVRTGMYGNILAIYPGVIYRSENNAASGPYGAHVRIEHVLPDGSKIRSMYAHMSMIYPRWIIGSKVNAGDVLGTSGKTGNAPAVHLHLTIKDDQDRYVDPLRYLSDCYTKSGGDQVLPSVKPPFAAKK